MALKDAAARKKYHAEWAAQNPDKVRASRAKYKAENKDAIYASEKLRVQAKKALMPHKERKPMPKYKDRNAIAALEFKVCKTCKTDKGICEFGKNSSIIGGISHRCKACTNEYNTKAVKANPEKARQAKRNWTASNPDKAKKSRANWECKNQDRLKLSRKKWKNDKYSNDPVYKLVHNTRSRLNGAVNRKAVKVRTMELLGCSPEQYRDYLEAKFEPGMNWSNHTHDGWHIDHIIPLASFDMTDVDQIKVAFHYTNTQPLWGTENMSKKDKLNWKKEGNE